MRTAVVAWLWRLLAIALLDGRGTPHPYPQLLRELRNECLRREIMDEREAFTIDDLVSMRKRNLELCNTPLICDAVRFPSKLVLDEVLTFNRFYKSRMEARRSDPLHGDEYREVVREADALYRIWDAVRDARTEHYYTPVRRRALLKVLKAVGPEAYWAGELPPFVPVWRFSEREIRETP